MRKKILFLILIGGLYFTITFIMSFFIKFPPFNHGLSIGFPVVYYQFNVSSNEIQHGIIRENLYFNILIIAVLYIIFYRFFRKK
ncbi:Uncharacterised protein [Myroides odoratus]|nr:hypothetical protein Myrod_0438 [Myroides odoratus DSM 2801]STZ32314.1 Uncharacterised protein [Myroides odoratus]